MLLYSAKESEPHLFQEELDTIDHSELDIKMINHRVNAALIREALKFLEPSPKKPVGIYVCGPPGMPEAMSWLCEIEGVSKESVKYEQWW